MQELIPQSSNGIKLETQRLAKNAQARLLPRSVVPLLDEIGKRLLNLSLYGDNPEFISQPCNHHQVGVPGKICTS